MTKRRLFLTLCGCMLLTWGLVAQTYTFTGVGNWNDNANWAAPNGRPSSPLESGESILINGTCLFNINNFRIEAGATLTIGTGTLMIGAGRNLNNLGTIEINSTATLNNSGTLRIQGSIDNNGDFINDGTVTGNGNINGDFENDGTIDFGIGGISTLAITGNYTASASADHIVEIRNNAASTNPQSDQLLVGGIARLGGTLTLIIDNPNDIDNTDAFYPILASGLVGSFSFITFPGNPADWTVNYTNVSLELSYNGAPLPIELTSFSGKQQGNAIELFWTTATETNNAFMAVEHSKDGTTFVEIGQRKGAGNSLTPRNYQLTDTKPFLGINYYRIRQVDAEGKTEYHKIITVPFKGKVAKDIEVLPTLVKDALTVVMPQPLPAGSTLQIWDMNGRLIQEVRVDTATERKEMDVTALPAGSYLVVAQNGSTLQSVRFVKM